MTTPVPEQTPVPTPVESAVAKVGSKLRELIGKGKVDCMSAVALVRATGDACRSVGVSKADTADVIEAVVVEIAKGGDGVLGTADDLVPANVLTILRSLCRNEVVRDLAAWAAEGPRWWCVVRAWRCIAGLVGR